MEARQNVHFEAKPSDAEASNVETVARVVPRMAELPADAWNALAGDSPFVQHAFLHALEATECVGAHIGCFSRMIHDRNPLARIIAVECCPENIPALERNVGHFATIVQAAVTYDQDVGLLSSVYPNCTSTGGCMVLARDELRRRVEEGKVFAQPGPGVDNEYWADFRPLKTVTLEDLLDQHHVDRIDLLKLDCEGAEFSILRNTTILDRIGLIVGEYHNKNEFLKLVEERLAGWTLRILKDAHAGLFWLVSPSLQAAG